MEDRTCPKCKHAMEEGRLSATGGELLVYVPGKEPGMLKQTTRISRGLACPNCGYVELYLDTEQLRKSGA